MTAHDAGGDVNLRLIPALVNEIRHYRPDVVHTHLVHADVVGQLAARGARFRGVVGARHTRVLATRAVPHDRSDRRPPGTSEDRDLRARGQILREVRLSPADRIRVVHYGIDADGWARAAPAPRMLASFGVADGDVVVGVPGRV